MNVDEYGEIINGEQTYEVIRNKLHNRESIIIGWTDEESTHYDILFTLKPYKQQDNYLQRGMRGNELYVSIIGTGCFGFDTDSAKHSGYIAEKLNLGNNTTTEKLTELINGIIGGK